MNTQSLSGHVTGKNKDRLCASLFLPTDQILFPKCNLLVPLFHKDVRSFTLKIYLIPLVNFENKLNAPSQTQPSHTTPVSLITMKYGFKT
jgi:hypothetical protein